MTLEVGPTLVECEMDPDSAPHVNYSLIRDAESEDPVKRRSLTHKNCEILKKKFFDYLCFIKAP